MLFIVVSFLVTIFCWGIYGPVLHWGQAGMATDPGEYARLLPFVCVGLAYFAIGVVVPLAWLGTKGEAGEWTTLGALLSLAAGALGAIGALGIILAFNFGGKPSYVMPLVFGGAPVVNSFLTIYLARKMKEIGPIFLAGLVMVVLGAVIVLVFKPSDAKPVEDPTAVAAADIDAEQADATSPAKDGVVVKHAKQAGNVVAAAAVGSDGHPVLGRLWPDAAQGAGGDAEQPDAAALVRRPGVLPDCGRRLPGDPGDLAREQPLDLLGRVLEFGRRGRRGNWRLGDHHGL